MATAKLFTSLPLMAACSLLVLSPSDTSAMVDIEPKREFRAAWVATVANIDWPSSPGLSTREQQDELLAILDQAVDLNLNAIIFQVRTMCDALYDSPHEPWSEFLTGQLGAEPSPSWDPLQFAIIESHKRGLELHAWVNPYRARHPAAESNAPADHVSRARPGIVREYGRYLWLDPTAEETKDHTLNVILDVVRRYNVDGVHIDDYFYPYPDYADGREFPDDANWRAYRAEGGTMERGDWRRHHVNDFVRRLYQSVKQEDPTVKVGISPFGIWRPNHPEGIQGMDQYDVLYADARLWLNEGWLDYLSPQLYWKMDQEAQSYTRLLAWWTRENKRGRHVWPGNFTSRIEQQGGWSPDEIINQITATRNIRGATGNIHFSMAALMQNRRRITDRLRAGAYSEPALVPPSPWLGREAPSRPEVEPRRNLETREIEISWRSPSNDDVRVWALHRQENGEWSMEIIPAHHNRSHRMTIPYSDDLTAIAVSAVDRVGNESERAAFRVR